MPLVRYAVILTTLFTGLGAGATSPNRVTRQLRRAADSVIDTCQNIIVNRHLYKFTVPAKLGRTSVFAPRVEFMRWFGPWQREGLEYVGRRAGVEWRIDLSSGRMAYEISIAPPSTLLTNVRRLADALINPVRDGIDDDHVHVYLNPRSNHLVIDLPADHLGLAVVTGLEGRRTDAMFEREPGPRAYTSQGVSVDDEEHAFILGLLAKQPRLGLDLRLDDPNWILRRSPVAAEMIREAAE